MLGRLFVVAAAVAVVALVLRLLQLGASVALLVVAVISGLIALVLGGLTLMQRRADRDAATR
jgi:hypothetical protein